MLNIDCTQYSIHSTLLYSVVELVGLYHSFDSLSLLLLSLPFFCFLISSLPLLLSSSVLFSSSDFLYPFFVFSSHFFSIFSSSPLLSSVVFSSILLLCYCFSLFLRSFSPLFFPHPLFSSSIFSTLLLFPLPIFSSFSLFFSPRSSPHTESLRIRP